MDDMLFGGTNKRPKSAGNQINSTKGIGVAFFSTECSNHAQLVVYSYWLSPGRMGCMILCRTFDTAPEQGRMGYVLIFQILKLFQVVF